MSNTVNHLPDVGLWYVLDYLLFIDIGPCVYFLLYLVGSIHFLFVLFVMTPA